MLTGQEYVKTSHHLTFLRISNWNGYVLNFLSFRFPDNIFGRFYSGYYALTVAYRILQTPLKGLLIYGLNIWVS